MSDLLASLGAASTMLGILLVLVFGGLWPIMAISVTLNIRKIARELARINNTIEARPSV